MRCGPRARPRCIVAVDGALAGPRRRRGPDQGDDRSRDPRPARAWLAIIMATGDNRRTAEAVARKTRHRRGARRRSARGQAGPRRRSAAPRARRWRWPATGSTTRPALAAADVGIAMSTGADVAVESAGHHAAEAAICAASCGRASWPRPRCATSGRTCSSPSPTMPRRPHRRRRALSLSGHPAVADDRGRGDEPVLGVGHHQCPAAQAGRSLTRPGPFAPTLLNLERKTT